MLSDNPYYLALSPAVEQRRHELQEFLLGEDPREETFRQGDEAVGDEAFRLRAWQERGRPAPRCRGRPRKNEKPAGSLATPAQAMTGKERKN